MPSTPESSAIVAHHGAAEHSANLGRVWTSTKFERAVRQRSDTAEQQLLGVFDVVNDLLNRADRESQSAIRALGNPAGSTPDDDRVDWQQITQFIATLAAEAELTDVDEFTHAWRLLLLGTISAAMFGDLEASQTARSLASDVLERSRPAAHLAAEFGDWAPLVDWDLEETLAQYIGKAQVPSDQTRTAATGPGELLTSDDYAVGEVGAADS